MVTKNLVQGKQDRTSLSGWSSACTPVEIENSENAGWSFTGLTRVARLLSTPYFKKPRTRRCQRLRRAVGGGEFHSSNSTTARHLTAQEREVGSTDVTCNGGPRCIKGFSCEAQS